MFCANGEEQFHGSPRATEEPLNAGPGLVARAESKTLVSSPGDGCHSCLGSLIRADFCWGREACALLQNLVVGTLTIEGSVRQPVAVRKLGRWPQTGCRIRAFNSYDLWSFSTPPRSSLYSLSHLCAVTQQKGKSSLWNLCLLSSLKPRTWPWGGSVSGALSLTMGLGCGETSEVSSRLPRGWYGVAGAGVIW